MSSLIIYTRKLWNFVAATNEDEQLLLPDTLYLSRSPLPPSFTLSASLSLSSTLPLVEHSLNCMSNCIIKIPIKKEALKLAVSAQRQRWLRRRCRRCRRLRLRRLHWAEVNRKITVEHDKRQCYQRNLINTAPRHSTPPTCSSVSHSTPSPTSPSFWHFPHTLCVLQALNIIAKFHVRK